MKKRLCVVLVCCLPSWAAQLVKGALPTMLIPHPLVYTVLLPDGYDPAGQPLPLLLALHGGNGDHDFSRINNPTSKRCGQQGRCPRW